MSKDPNLSALSRSEAVNCEGDVNCEAVDEHLDIAAAVDQHLSSLQQAGVVFLPGGSGQNFELPQLAEAAEATDQRLPEPNLSNPPNPSYSPAASASVVKESTAPVAASANDSQSDSPSTPPLTPANTAEPQPATNSGLNVAYPAPVAADQRAATLQILADEVAECTRCQQLCENRTQTVFGVGDPNSRLVFVGEGPGEQEDRTGQPFVGAAGQLLDKILAACGLDRSQVYILNTVKCRPPQNRNPKPDELDNCWGFAQRQLDTLQPKFICCLGSVAAKTVLKTNQSVGKLRGRFHQYRDSQVIVTYHPAYLLRTSSAKVHAWNDMQTLMQAMGIKIPGK